MTFLAPWFLLLGGAAAVPLLIHLLRRRIALRLDFPAARYLARAERDHSRTLRMRNLLLMILRTLAVLLVALAAARPRATGVGTGHAPSAIAIVLDNSMSTSVVEGDAPVLQRLKQQAHTILARAATDDRLWLVTSDATARGGSVAALNDALERVQPYAGAGRLRDAVTRALTTVSASGMDARQVIVLTDGQRTTWSDPVTNRGDVPVVVWAPATLPPANRSITLAEARPIRWTPSGAVAAQITSADSVTYRIALGGRTLARGTSAPGEEAVVHASPAERGWIGGSVEIEPDEMPADNVRYFAMWIGPAPNVRVDGSAGPFARNAVDVLRSSDRLTEHDGAAIAITAADLATSLPALLLPPTDNVRLGVANRALERLGVPWRFGALRREAAVARGEGIASANVSWRYELVPQGGANANALARVGTSPWIVAGDRYVLVGSPLVPEATSLPVSAAFLPWLADVIPNHLHGDPGTVQYAAPGELVTPPDGATALETPSGARTSLSASQFDAPGQAGTYFYIDGANRAGALVVNAEASESRLDRWPTSTVAAHVVSSNGRAVTDAQLASAAFASVAGRSLAGPLLAFAIVVLIVEALIAGAGTRARA
jgi:Aerotolerance regulator N-terminal